LPVRQPLGLQMRSGMWSRGEFVSLGDHTIKGISYHYLIIGYFLLHKRGAGPVHLFRWLLEALKRGLTPGRSSNFDFSAADPQKELPIN